MSTEPKDIDHETEPLLQALKADLPALRYAKTLDHAPRLLPSGWAAVLYLYYAR